MHRPDATARSSVFYRYRVHPFCRPQEMTAQPPCPYPVAIVGAGPIGMAMALDLARFGVASVLLEAEVQVSHGSRAIVLTRRSLEILQQIGVVQPFIDKGLPWSRGRSFYRGQEIYQMLMPHEEDSRFLPGLNIQQQYIEQYLVEACQACPSIDLRWGSKLVGLTQNQESVTLRIDTPEGDYDLHARWAVAADGGRSTVRQLLNVRMTGRSYPGYFVIADILAKIDLPTERLCFFDPAWNPGNNVLVHRQPDDLWRLDFRLPDGESAERALAPERLSSRIQAILAMLGQEVPWQLDWATVYCANTLTLPDYRVGRVIFAGDAAHLLPIFGVRGANTGFQDSNNLAWKLAFVIKGLASDGLLASYSQERVTAALEICDEGGKSTRFMTPPSRGYRLLRDAVLSWSLSEDFAKELLHWRTSRPHIHATSPLNSFPQADAAFTGGVRLGEAARNVKLADEDYLFDRLAVRAGFHLLLFAGPNGLTDDQRAILAALDAHPVPIVKTAIGRCAEGGDLAIADPNDRISDKYCAPAGSAYLFRPDFHLAARWPRACAKDILHALRVATAMA